MKAGNFNTNDYLTKLYEEAEANTDKGYLSGDIKDGLLFPEDTKKNFEWLKKEYQKGKTEVKVEIKGEGSSFKPGYNLQTDLDSVKDFKPGLYGAVKTEQSSKTEDPKSPKNKKEETSAEDTEPKNAKESTEKSQTKPAVNTIGKTASKPGASNQSTPIKKTANPNQMKINIPTKSKTKEDAKK